MKLHIDFDDELMYRYHRRGASPLLTIYWTLGQEAYPQEGWVDFGTVVLGWWLVAGCSLLAGSRKEVLPFMDGPYQLSVRPVRELFYVSASDSTEECKVSQTAFFNELLTAANRTTTKLNELGLPDSTGLQIGVKKLKAAFSEQETRSQIQQRVKQYVQH